MVPVALARHAAVAVRGPTLRLTLVAGAFDALANLTFLLASRSGLLSLAAVLTSLYPAVTVLLAAGVLRERPTALQRVGLGAAVVAIVLITA